MPVVVTWNATGSLHSKERAHLARDHRRELGQRLPHLLVPLPSPLLQPDHFAKWSGVPETNSIGAGAILLATPRYARPRWG